MRKFENVTETEDLLDDILEGMDLLEQQEEETEEISVEDLLVGTEETKSKKKKKEKKPKAEKKKEEPQVISKEEDGFNPNGLPMVLERIEAGLIGSLKITDSMNAPIFKPEDIAQLRKPNRLLVKDFVLYKMGEDYYLRRIIKYKGDDIYVAGDNEREYHVIRKENVIAKAVARERGKTFLSLGFNPKNKFYTFCKVNLAPVRLGNRVKSYDEDQNAEAFEAAMQNMETQAQRVDSNKIDVENIVIDVDLDSDLKSFLDPDELVRELRGEAKAQPVEEEIVYVDEDGNEISKEEYEANYVSVEPEEEPKQEETPEDDEDDESIEEIDEDIEV